MPVSLLPPRKQRGKFIKQHQPYELANGHKVILLDFQPEGRADRFEAILGLGTDARGHKIANLLASLNSNDPVVLTGTWAKKSWNSSAGTQESFRFEAVDIALLPADQTSPSPPIYETAPSPTPQETRHKPTATAQPLESLTGTLVLPIAHRLLADRAKAIVLQVRADGAQSPTEAVLPQAITDRDARTASFLRNLQPKTRITLKGSWRTQAPTGSTPDTMQIFEACEAYPADSA